ncbi:MAG: hypothetical protein WCP28_05050 [Actinomycetes bacterium]
MGVTPKVLRATAISNAIRAGASVVTAQKMAGHMTPQVTLMHYAAYFPDDSQSLRRHVDEAWATMLEKRALDAHSATVVKPAEDVETTDVTEFTPVTPTPAKPVVRRAASKRSPEPDRSGTGVDPK